MNPLLRLLLLISPLGIQAQPDSSALPSAWEKLQRFSLSGYGAMNYYHFQWQTDSVKRNAIDNERFILELGYRWNSRLRLNTEIEFEHGGTGSDIEFDRFEEFGEFEYEISKGGEVLLEQMNLEFGIGKQLRLKAGRIKLPFALMFQRDEPTDYYSAAASEMEMQLLPENWTENGLSLQGMLDKKRRWRYYIALVNGLDNSAFNSANWIKRGNQRRFELVNAENFALCGRIDFHASDQICIGFSAYGSRTGTGNRPKPDLNVDTPLGLAEFHLQYAVDPFRLNAMLLYGALGNSEALSNQNRNLSNNLNVKRTPVGASAAGAYAEAGLLLIGKGACLLTHSAQTGLLYARYDYYDTQFATEGLIFNNPRWERNAWSLGAVYSLIDEVQLKLQYTDRLVGAPAPTSINGGRHERTFIGGFAFEF